MRAIYQIIFADARDIVPPFWPNPLKKTYLRRKDSTFHEVKHILYFHYFQLYFIILEISYGQGSKPKKK